MNGSTELRKSRGKLPTQSGAMRSAWQISKSRYELRRLEVALGQDTLPKHHRNSGM